MLGNPGKTHFYTLREGKHWKTGGPKRTTRSCQNCRPQIFFFFFIVSEGISKRCVEVLLVETQAEHPNSTTNAINDPPPPECTLLRACGVFALLCVLMDRLVRFPAAASACVMRVLWFGGVEWL